MMWGGGGYTIQGGGLCNTKEGAAMGGGALYLNSLPFKVRSPNTHLSNLTSSYPTDCV